MALSVSGSISTSMHGTASNPTSFAVANRWCWDHLENVKEKRIEKLRAKLIPEFQKALNNGNVSLNLAYAIAKFSLEEQENFVRIIGKKVSEAHKTKVEVLEKALMESKQALQELERRDSLKEEEIAGLKDRLKKIRAEREKIKARIEELTEDRHRLVERMQRFETEIEHLRRNPPAEVQKKIEIKQKEIDRLIQEQEEKDRIIESLKTTAAEFRENADLLAEELEKARQKQRQLSASFERQLNEKIKEMREQEKNKDNKEAQTAPLFARYSALIDVIMGILEEVIGNVEEFNQEQKEQLLEKMNLLEAQCANVRDALKDTAARYDYE